MLTLVPSATVDEHEPEQASAGPPPSAAPSATPPPISAKTRLGNCDDHTGEEKSRSSAPRTTLSDEPSTTPRGWGTNRGADTSPLCLSERNRPCQRPCPTVTPSMATVASMGSGAITSCDVSSSSDSV